MFSSFHKFRVVGWREKWPFVAVQHRVGRKREWCLSTVRCFTLRTGNAVREKGGGESPSGGSIERRRLELDS